MLGQRIADPHLLEDGDIDGLGLLDVTTTLAPEKVTRQHAVRWTGGGELHGYEIHHGQTRAGPGVQVHLDDGLGWQQDNVWGVYLHGLMENTAYHQRFLERLGWQAREAWTPDWSSLLDAELDRVSREVMATGWTLD